MLNNMFLVYRAPEKPTGTGDLLAKSEARKKLPDKNLDFQVGICIYQSHLPNRHCSGENGSSDD